MKYICIGAGSIGKRHVRNLISIGVNKENISVVDPRKDRLEEISDLGINTTFENLQEAMEAGSYDASIICSPTNLHIEQGIELAKKGIHILMEKPLAHDLEGLQELAPSFLCHLLEKHAEFPCLHNIL